MLCNVTYIAIIYIKQFKLDHDTRTYFRLNSTVLIDTDELCCYINHMFLYENIYCKYIHQNSELVQLESSSKHYKLMRTDKC